MTRAMTVANGHERAAGGRQEEVTRLMIQALHEMGYGAAAASLERESGCSIESADVAAFRAAVLAGAWETAEGVLGRIELREGAELATLQFYVRQQKYLELLEQRDMVRALGVLRGELAPLEYDTRQLHFLSGLMMCASVADLRTQARWSGAGGDSRQVLLGELQKCISPAVMIPPGRLQTLLDQAQRYQECRCVYHNPAGPTTLYADHVCGRQQLPTTTAKVLTAHESEVWFTMFSHDGARLATASADRTVIIWDTRTFEPVHVLREHSNAVTVLAWSADDSRMITGGYERRIKIWDTASGECLATIDGFTEPLTACEWLPSGDEFLTSSLDPNRSITLWHGIHDPKIVFQWNGSRIYDIALTPDGQRVVAICNETRLQVYDVASRKCAAQVETDAEMTCVSVSRDGRCALVSCKNKEVQIWDLASLRLVRRCLGQVQKQYVIRSCFGGGYAARPGAGEPAGVVETFVVSGSEDANVYVWRRDDGNLLAVLPGHAKTVNSVSWNPVDRHMFVSASDDGTVRVWSTQ
ncbi:WD40-repeat-containing domain protein [Dipodascopsis tothii]|uniref:WD40-repeat-containing domain protein n=1 Tax=Dipodascopsis tothii TaxID=44089 RepID=UPI0034CDC738